MNELEILNYYQLSFVANAIYSLTFAALIFITFRLIRLIWGKYFHFNISCILPLYSQLAQSYRLSELLSNGVELSEVTKSYIDFTGYTVAEGWPPAFMPEPAALVFLITFTVMVIAGVWVNLTKD